MIGENIKAFYIIGLAIRTSNQNGQSSLDIPALWNKFIAEGILEKIPDKINNTIYCIYTDYEKDHTTPYTTILGCKVSTLDNKPVGMEGRTIAGERYSKQVVKGNLLKGLVYNEWLKIWDSGLSRKFSADFEVYDERSLNPENAEVDIFVAIE